MAESKGNGAQEHEVQVDGRYVRVRTAGLRGHTSPTLTTEQQSSMSAPKNDFKAKLESAVRHKTSSLKVGELE